MRLRLAFAAALVACSAPPKQSAEPAAAPPPASASPADSEPAPAPPIAAAVSWTEIRSWDGLFVIGVPEEADVDEFLMALVPIRGTVAQIDFTVRLEKNPITTSELLAWEPSGDKSRAEVKLDSKDRVKFVEHYEDGGTKTALRDVVIHRGKTMAVVWESIYRQAPAADEKNLALQAEMASRFRLEKPAP